MDLKQQKCVPCEGGVEPLKREEFAQYLDQVKEWVVIADCQIAREVALKDFVTAIEFVNLVANLAEQERHHPDILIHDWNRVKVMLSTHAIGGLSINDFVLAVRIDEILNSIDK